MKVMKNAKTENILENTKSICPICNKIIDAVVFEKEGKVFIRKKCKQHGNFEDVYWSDYELYKKAKRYAKDGHGISNPNIKKRNPVCPKDCGLCRIHKSHSALANIVVTNRCDLSCWYCLPKDEEIIVKMDGKIVNIKIGELAEKWFSKNSEKIGNFGEFSVPKNLKVMTMNGNKIKWTDVTKIFKRKYAGKFIRVKTESGKEIITTADHRFITYDNKKIIRKKAENNAVLFSIAKLDAGNGLILDLLEEFRKLPKNEMKKIYIRNIKKYFSQLNCNINELSKKIDVNTSSLYSWKHRDSMPLDQFYNFIKNTKINLNTITFGVDGKKYIVKRKLKITPNLAKLIGYFVCDGHYSKQNIWFTCKDRYVRNDIETCLKELGLTYTIIKVKNKAEQINVGNKIFSLIFRYVLGIPKGSHNKRLPRNFISFDEKSRIKMLEGMFNSDGYVVRGERHASIGIGSVSRNLISDASRLLATLSIKSRIHKMSMKNNPLANTDVLYKLYISSEDMLETIKKIKLKPSHKNKLKNLSPRKVSKLIVNGDFILDKIKSIEEFKSGKKIVYDLEVKDKSHSFIAGDGILISNCFFFAGRVGYVYEPTLKQIDEMVKNLVREKPIKCNAVQITGGEPCLRDDLIEIVKICKKHGIEHIQLNTNGIRLSKDLNLAMKLRESGVRTLYLSFDGVTAKTNPKNHWEIPGVLENCRKAGIGIVLVPTVIKSINDHELGDIIKFGFKNIDIVRAVNFQPVSLVGRLTNKEREKYRITIPDAIKNIEEQTAGAITKDDFFPVPTAMKISGLVEKLTGKPEYSLSSHFACGMATYVFNANGKLMPITRFIDVEGVLEYFDKIGEEIQKGKSKYMAIAKLLFKLNSFIDKKKAPKEFNIGKILYNAIVKHNYNALGDFHRKSMMIGMMHFMDKYNYDIERVKRCCIHYALTDGRIIPFCAFNVIPEWYRDKNQKSQGISFKEWEKKHGKLSDALYKRNPEEMKKVPDNLLEL